MTRFATPIILASLLAIGCDNTIFAANEKPRTCPQPPVPAEQQTKPPEIAADGDEQPVEATRKRLSEKVERVKQGVQKWASSGRDPPAILKTMDLGALFDLSSR